MLRFFDGLVWTVEITGVKSCVLEFLRRDVDGSTNSSLFSVSQREVNYKKMFIQ